MFTPLPCTAARHTPLAISHRNRRWLPLAASAGDPPNLVPTWAKAMPGAAPWRGTGWRWTLLSPPSGGRLCADQTAEALCPQAPRMVVRGCPIGGVCPHPPCLPLAFPLPGWSRRLARACTVAAIGPVDVRRSSRSRRRLVPRCTRERDDERLWWPDLVPAAIVAASGCAPIPPRP